MKRSGSVAKPTKRITKSQFWKWTLPFRLMALGAICFLSWFLSTSCQKNQAKPFVIGFSQCTNSDEWRATMLEGMNRELAFYPNIKMSMKNADGQSEVQVRQIQEFIDAKIDLLIVSPNEADPVTPIIEKAYDQGIPVVVVDRRTSSNKYTAFVGADNYEVGQNAGIYANVLLAGKGKIMEVTGLPGASPVIDRHNGFMDAIKPIPGLEYVEKVDGDWSKKNFALEVEKALRKHTDVNLIFAQNDDIGQRTRLICKALNLHNVKIIGIDGLSTRGGGVDLVEQGVLDASILYPTGGEEAIQLAIKILGNTPLCQGK